jgi:RimJ/RimL family protein N-acetyltransferase
MAERLVTERLVLRPWHADDADAALRVFGDEAVARWLSPAMDRVLDVSAMRLLLQQWTAEDSRLIAPAGRWAIELKNNQRLVGGAVILPLPPGNLDLGMGWHLDPSAWGHGYATEASRALAAWAFDHDVDEILAVVRPTNSRAAATVGRIGMEWVGETEKYYDLRLQVYRLRPADLDPTPPHPD